MQKYVVKLNMTHDNQQWIQYYGKKQTLVGAFSNDDTVNASIHASCKMQTPDDFTHNVINVMGFNRESDAKRSWAFKCDVQCEGWTCEKSIICVSIPD